MNRGWGGRIRSKGGENLCMLVCMLVGVWFSSIVGLLLL